MKKLIFAAAIAATLFVQNTFAQTSASQALQKAIASYLNVKNALTKDNADSAAAYAKALSTDIHNMPMEKFSAGQHKIWMKYYKELENEANQVSSKADLKEQRK